MVTRPMTSHDPDNSWRLAMLFSNLLFTTY